MANLVTKSVIKQSKKAARKAQEIKDAPAQGANSAPKQKNIQSAQGNTSNAFTHKVAKRPSARDEETSAQIRADWKNRKDQIKNQIAEYNRRGGGLSDEVRARNEAGQKQTQTRERYDKLPSLDDFTSQSVFNGANKHFNDGNKTSAQRYKDLLDALDAGYASAQERFSGTKTAGKLAQAITGSEEYGKALTQLLRNQRALNDYASMPIAGGPVIRDIDKMYEEHPTAEKIGDAIGHMAQYGALSSVLPTLPGISAAQAGLATKFGGGALGNYLANTAIDMIPDLALDVAPNAINNAASGMSAGDIAKEAVKDTAVNGLLNLGANSLSFIPELIQGVKDIDLDFLDDAIKTDNGAFLAGEAPLDKTVSSNFRRNWTPAKTPKTDPYIKEMDSLAKELDFTHSLNTPEALKGITEQAADIPTNIDHGVAQSELFRKLNEARVKGESPQSVAANSANWGFIYEKNGVDYEVTVQYRMDDARRNIHYAEQANVRGRQELNSRLLEGQGIEPGVYRDADNLLKNGSTSGGNGNLSEPKPSSNGTGDTGHIGSDFKELQDGEQLTIDELLAPEAKQIGVPENDILQAPQRQSEFYTNTVKKTTSPEYYENYIDNIAKNDTVNVKSDEWKSDIAKRRIETDGADVWADRIINAKEIAAEDITTAKALTEIFDESNPELSARVRRALRPHITNSAQNLQAVAEWGKTAPEMNLEVGLAKARKAVDDYVKKPGYSDAVNNMADKVQDAIEKGNFDEVKRLLKEKLSSFAVGTNAKNVLAETGVEGEQMVLDLIGGYSPNKKSLKELAEEASSAMRKLNGVADFSTSDESAVMIILKQMENYEVGTREYKELQSMAAGYIDSKIPTHLPEKIKTVLYDNMLGNFRTALSRNFGGNAVANSLEKVQKPLKTGIDKLTSNVTGKRNYILDSRVSKAYGEGFKKGVAEQLADMKTGLNTTRSGEEEFVNALNNVHKVFKGDGKLSKALNSYDKAVKGVMQLGDRPFYEAEYAAAKEELNIIVDKFGKDALQRTGLPAEALKDTDSIIEFWARNRALEACFQNGSLTANALTQIKQGLGMVSKEAVGYDVLSQSAMPFTQVAGNMFGRLTDYIPGLGSVKNTVNTIGELTNGNFNQKRFVDATSRNLTGLGLLAGGAAMADNVANGGRFGTTGDYSSDSDEKAAQIASGFQPYALQIPWGEGVRQINIDDIPVIGPELEASAKFAEAFNNNPDNLGEGLYQGVKGAISSSLENAALQGLNRLTGQNNYNSDFGDNVLQTVASLPGQAIPSLLRQTTQVIDPYKRDLGEYGTGEYAMNSVINSTPFRMALNPKIDAEGLPVLQNQGRGVGEKILENMLLPWTVSEPQYSDLVKSAQDIKAGSTDNTSKAFPGTPSRSTVKDWLGDNYSGENYYNVKKDTGTLNRELGNRIINEEWFNNLSADEQADVMSKAYAAINGVVRENNALDYTSTNSLTKAYQTGGANAFMDELKRQTMYSHAGVNSSKYIDDAYDQGEEAFNQAVENKEALSEYGYNTGNKKALEALNNGELDEYAQIDQALKAHGYNASDENIDFINHLPSLDDFEEYAGYVDNHGLKNNTQTRTWFSEGGLDALEMYDAADADNDSSLKKDELRNYLRKQGYTLEQANAILAQYTSWKAWTDKQYNK